MLGRKIHGRGEAARLETWEAAGSLDLSGWFPSDAPGKKRTDSRGWSADGGVSATNRKRLSGCCCVFSAPISRPSFHGPSNGKDVVPRRRTKKFGAYAILSHKRGLLTRRGEGPALL